MVLNKTQKLQFIKDGYIVLQNAISKELIFEAQRHVNKAFDEEKYSNKKDKQEAILTFFDSVQQSSILTDLIWKSRVREALEDLLGPGNISILGDGGQVTFRPRSNRQMKEGMAITDSMRAGAWHIDGPQKYVKCCSAFTVLVGVPLSPGQDIDENRGQLNVWAGMFFIVIYCWV